MNITPTDFHKFTGTENYFKTIYKSIIYTDGVQYFARNAGDQGVYPPMILIYSHGLSDSLNLSTPKHPAIA